MLYSLALVFLLGMLLGKASQKLGLPPLFGMLLAGILLGPSVFDLLSPSLSAVSADLRKVALLIILARAGLNLDVGELRQVGRPAFLMCFLPATCEIVGMILLAPPLLGLSLLESALLGAVIAAVSPAVVVPKMLSLLEKGWGKNHHIPQLVMAGASADDVYVIVLFSVFSDLCATGHFSPLDLLRIPTSIVLGCLAGLLLGQILARFCQKWNLLPVRRLLLAEDLFTGFIGFSGLLAVMAMGVSWRHASPKTSLSLSGQLSLLWSGAEILLFVLVGAQVDVSYAFKAGPMAVLLLLGVLLFRMMGVGLSLLKTPLNKKERLFCALAYTPKATVQAAIGSVPLAMGLPCGELAVLAILITAPLGAFAIDRTFPRLLQSPEEN